VSSGVEAGVDKAAAAPSRGPGRVAEFAPAIAAMLLILYGAVPGAGLMLPLWAPVLLIWFARMMWIAVGQPSRRRAQGIKAVAIGAAMAIAVATQGYYERESRAQAQSVVDAVSKYHARHGNYPDDLAQVGLDVQRLRRAWKVHYLSRDGQHAVVYPARLTVFSSYSYDLDKPGWTYNAD
jgi:hypothetical protein